MVYFFRQVYYRKIFYQIVDQLINEYTDLLTTLKENLKHVTSLWPSKISKSVLIYLTYAYYKCVY